MFFYLIRTLYFSIVVVFCSCVKEVNLDIKPTIKTISINSIITEQDTFFVQVSRPVDPLGNQFNFISDAKVVLNTSEGDAYSLDIKNSHYFLPNFEYKANLEYSIEVRDVLTDSIYIAQTITPERQSWTAGDFQPYFGLDEEGYNISSIKVTFNDDPLKANYYGVRIIAFHNNNSASYLLYPRSNDPVIINEGILIYYPQGLVFSDALLSDQPNDLIIQFDYDPVYGTQNYLVIEFYTLSKSFYKYKKSYLIHDYNQEPFNGDFINFFEPNEPINLYSNIDGGLGVFGALTVMRDTIFMK